MIIIKTINECVDNIMCYMCLLCEIKSNEWGKEVCPIRKIGKQNWHIYFL